MTISIDQVIAAAKMKLRLTDGQDADNFLELQILHAIRNIGSLDSFRKCNAIIDIVDGYAALPCDFYRILALRMKNPIATETTDPCNTLGYNAGVYVDRPFLYQVGCDFNPNCNDIQGSYQIQGGNIVFNSSVNFEQVAIAYLAFATDDAGRYYIEQDMERGLAAYAAWQYALSFEESYTREQRMEWKQEYVNQAKWIKGVAAVKNFQTNRQEIMERVNALIADKTTSWI